MEAGKSKPVPKPISKRGRESEDEDDVEEVDLAGVHPMKIVRLKKRAVGDDTRPPSSRLEPGAVRDPSCSRDMSS